MSTETPLGAPGGCTESATDRTKRVFASSCTTAWPLSASSRISSSGRSPSPATRLNPAMCSGPSRLNRKASIAASTPLPERSAISIGSKSELWLPAISTSVLPKSPEKGRATYLPGASLLVR